MFISRFWCAHISRHSISGFCESFIFRITLISRFWAPQFTLFSSTVTTKQFSQCPQVVRACTWIFVLESIHHNIHLNGKVLPTEKMKSKKYDFVNVSVVINSFFLDHWYNVSHLIHLIFASCYVGDTYWSRHFSFAIFFVSRNSRN